MNYTDSYSRGLSVAELGSQARGAFVSRTYAHLFGAIAAFTLIEVALFKSGVAEGITRVMAGSWLLVLGGFVLVSWLASHVALRAVSKPAQYAALAGFVVAEALIFVPLLYLANEFAPGVIASAAGITLVAFAALTAVVFITRKDFSFLRGILMWGGIIALVLIVASLIFGGFTLGLWFSVGMVAFAGACILYDTSNILHHYPEDRYVAAALSLFASVALMFCLLPTS